MPINVNSPEYVKAEKEFYEANTLEDQLIALKIMISYMPKHKGAENLRQQLTTRRKKLENLIIKKKKSSKSSKTGIKKSDMQAVIVGKTNSGKSNLLKFLTNASPKISKIQFTTQRPEIGMMNYATTQIQIIENPAIDSPNYNKGLTNSADTLILIATSLEEIELLKKQIKTKQKQIIVFNKIDLFDTEQRRKLEATLKSKKYNFVIVSTKTSEGLEDLKGKIFQSFDKIRIYTKDPNKKEHDTKKPVILKPGATVKKVAEKILHGFSKQVKQIKIWGPSSKFPGQVVGLNHKLKDLDIVEFKTR